MVNTYVVYAQGADSCVVIDPADAAPIKKYAETYGLKIAAVLLTHCHFDHILGVHGLVQGGASCISAKMMQRALTIALSAFVLWNCPR